MYDELITDTDYFDGYSVFDSSPHRFASSSGAADTSAADELALLDNSEDITSLDNITESDNDYSDILDNIELNTESIATIQEDLATYFASQELLLQGLIILILGFIVLSIVRKTFDIFL